MLKCTFLIVRPIAVVSTCGLLQDTLTLVGILTTRLLDIMKEVTINGDYDTTRRCSGFGQQRGALLSVGRPSKTPPVVVLWS